MKYLLAVLLSFNLLGTALVFIQTEQRMASMEESLEDSIQQVRWDIEDLPHCEDLLLEIQKHLEEQSFEQELDAERLEDKLDHVLTYFDIDAGY